MPNVPIPKPENRNSLSDNFTSFFELVSILRKECPWDREQTNESIAHLMVEEVYETIDAIYQKDFDEFSKELGDLLLHIVMHSVIASETEKFDMIAVIRKIHHKMVSRHPHVFGDVVVSGEDQVTENWEKLKLKEGKKSVLQGVPKSLPALLRAERIQHKASKVGFDWDNRDDVWKKVDEELQELKDEIKSGNTENVRKEFGDFIFSIVNAARFEGIVAEEALHLTNNKFTKRFQYIEKRALELELDLNNMTLEEMDKLWDEAKEKGIDYD